MNPEWKKRHDDALRTPRGFEHPLVALLDGWLAYATHHLIRYESGIGADGVLGDEWAGIGRGLLGLLNGATGRLDCSTLDKLIRDTLASEGFES